MLIILDRDGFINQYHGQYICALNEWIPLPGVAVFDDLRAVTDYLPRTVAA